MKGWLNKLVVQFWIPLVASTFLVVGVIAIYLPARQEKALTQFNHEALLELTKTMSISIRIALEKDDYSAIKQTIDYVAGSNTLTFAAIVLEEDGQPMVLAKYPADFSDDIILNPSEVHLTERQMFSTTALEGYVILGTDNAYFNEELWDLNRGIYLFLLFMFVATLIINYLLAQRFTRPVISATNVSRELSRRNYDIAIPMRVQVTELKELARSLNSLRNSMREKDEENRKLTNNMQSEIARQTRQLSEALVELEQSQLITDNVINTALDAVITADARGNVIKWNRAATQIFGFTEEEAMGKPLTELIIPPQMAGAHDKGMAHYHNTGEGPVLNKQIEIIARTKAGTTIDVELFITPIRVGDTVIFSSFIRDITESKRLRQMAEEQRSLMNNILNALPIDIYLKNEHKQFVFVNKSFIQTTGVDSQLAMMKTNTQLFTGEILDTLEREDAEAWASDRPVIKELVRYLDEGNQYYLVGRQVVTIRHDEQNQVRYLISFALDITNTKEAEEQLRKALKAKDEFLSTMSHEIRTPLHSIMGLSDLLLKQSQTDEQKDMMQSVSHSAQHLMGLINDILDFSKISSGKLELHPEYVNLERLSGHIMKQFENQAADKGLELSLQLPNTLKHKVLVDDIRLSQVLNNLLSNAVKFTAKGKVSLMVEEIGRSTSGVTLRFTISDTGKGIHPDNIGKVQEAFMQESSSISREYGGTGLGLSIVNSLLQLMHSKMHIESTLGEGSRFSFTLVLPLGRQIQEETVSAQLPTMQQLPMELLYVEDTIPNQFLMKKMVKPWGVHLSVVSSAEEALEICRQKAFDLILMDIQMPIIDGIEAFGMIRRESQLNVQTHVVAFTANAEISDVNRYKELGFHAVITKPIAPDKLYSFLQSFYRNHVSIH